MYVKIKNQTVEKYPFSINELQKENPQTSFPKNPSNELLAEWGVFPVLDTSQPEVDHTKNVIEVNPIFENGKWVRAWQVSDASEQEIADRTINKAIKVRAHRDKLIAETDWLVVKHLELNENVPGRWEVYRQDLRDVPSQSGFPFNVTWPVKPT